MLRSTGGGRSRRSAFLTSRAAAVVLATAIMAPAAHAEFTVKDAQVMGRVLGFLDQAPPATVNLAIVYDGGSKSAAEALAGQLSGMKAGNFTLVPKAVSIGDVGGVNANAILLMNGVGGAGKVADVTRSKKIPCFTGDDSQVKSGACLIGIKSDPKVEILLNGALSKSSGITFGAAFRMMITEI